MALRIKDWGKFQHFKDRRPPWIKLYRDLLDDVEWHELDAVAAKALVMIWLIASENDGEIPDVRKLAFRLRLSVSATENVISSLSHWVEVSCDSAISDRYQSDAPERERERERERDRERGRERYRDKDGSRYARSHSCKTRRRERSGLVRLVPTSQNQESIGHRNRFERGKGRGG